MKNKYTVSSGLRTSVRPDGVFVVGVHNPAYRVANLRENVHLLELGTLSNGSPVSNKENFVAGDVEIYSDRQIYEIANPFPFRGCTYIDSSWAVSRAADPATIRIAQPPRGSVLGTLKEHVTDNQASEILSRLPVSVLYTIAQNSDDPDELKLLAGFSCRLQYGPDGMPTGLRYLQRGDRVVADIDDFELFETIANNPALPDAYKEVMVLRPGVQGTSEIVGDVQSPGIEVFEYLRGNSYIPGGHYAANFAHTSIRYRVDQLSGEDMQALRHLYYQRTYVRLAEEMGVSVGVRSRRLSGQELEELRQAVNAAGQERTGLGPATLWGWNFGYDFSGSGYRLHASHQMIHQQYAMVAEAMQTTEGATAVPFACGDMVADTVARYRHEFNSCFFSDLIKAIRVNRRVDGGNGEASLVVWEDENVMLFVPKAQVSQWELQLVVTADGADGAVGNIVEADAGVRASLDAAILHAQKALASIGAQMVTSIEFSKRLGLNNGQRLLYSFLPKLPWAMGGFSEAQSRFICGHYPEDFAAACRQQINDV